jgi:hypothetical protein
MNISLWRKDRCDSYWKYISRWYQSTYKTLYSFCLWFDLTIIYFERGYSHTDQRPCSDWCSFVIHNWSINSITEKFSNILTLYEKRGIYIYIYIMDVLHHKVIEKYSILIGYYTVLCTIWKDIVRVCIVLKTRIGRDATGVQYGFSIQYGRVQYISILYITLYNDLFIIQLKWSIL